MPEQTEAALPQLDPPIMGREFGFKGTSNVRAAIENRDIAVLGRSAFPSQAFNLADDVLGFAFGMPHSILELSNL